MQKYKVVVGTLFVGKTKYRRGDIIETDIDFGTRVEPYIEPQQKVEPQQVAEPEAKPKRKRRTKAEMEAARLAEAEAARLAEAKGVEFDVPRYGEEA